METAIASGGFAVALTCAVLMGFGVQRGATCAVSAMDEMFTHRRAAKLLAIVEAGLWVAGSLILLRTLGFTMVAPKAYVPGGWTILGGVLLGLGAWVNRACVFGTVARVGSGEWTYLLTPVGFVAGCFAVAPLVRLAPHAPASPPALALSVLLVPFAALVFWRLWQVVQAARSRAVVHHIWSPHNATVVIGITFVVRLLTVGAWAYTDALAEFALGGMGVTAWRVLLLCGLFGGAVLAGRTGGTTAAQPTLAGAVRCLSGGFLLGAGGVLAPGSNDGLLLLGIPLLLPYAWVAFSAMMATLAIVLMLTRRSWVRT